jgi:tRNA-specific 2-thiouridylase
LKAIGLFSGGLDSILATKIMLDQGIEVIALNFTLPFHQPSSDKNNQVIKAARALKIPIKTFDIGLEYIKIIRNAKYGFGSGMNPCIDCKIYMIRKAKSYAKRIGAKFLFTGEVLGERPMSQNIRALRIIEKETGLEGKIVRPLSAKLLPETEAEKNGWVNRNKLFDIKGRSRKIQIMLAKKYGITHYPTPAGGCLLTYEEYAGKIKDLIQNKSRIKLNDIQLLRIGRHFRYKKNKIIVGRDEEENKKLLELKNKGDYYFEASEVGSPITILQGLKNNQAINLAAQLTARYSDAAEEPISVKYYLGSSEHLVQVKNIDENKLNEFKI